MALDRDLQIRLAAIDHCHRLRSIWNEAVPAGELTRGFVFQGEVIKLVHWGRGVFKPEQLNDGPLSVTSSLASTYADEHIEGNRVLYDFAPPAFEWANRGLHALAKAGRPIIMFKQVKEKPGSEYMIFAPVYVGGSDWSRRTFRLILDENAQSIMPEEPTISGLIEKRYGEVTAKVRIHQAHFRRDILAVYRERCCICELRERPLIDAAHITSDSDLSGEPVVQNGLAMCPSHHRAFDRHLFDIDTDYRVQVRESQLAYPQDEATKSLLWRFHDRAIFLPTDRAHHPDRQRLTRRHLVA